MNLPNCCRGERAALVNEVVRDSRAQGVTKAAMVEDDKKKGGSTNSQVITNKKYSDKRIIKCVERWKELFNTIYPGVICLKLFEFASICLSLLSMRLSDLFSFLSV